MFVLGAVRETSQTRFSRLAVSPFRSPPHDVL